MNEHEQQPPDKPKRTRAPQGTRRTGRKRAQQTPPASTPAQETATALAAPDSTDSATPQELLAAEAPASPVPDEPPVGERWGEFPPTERQAELSRMWREWELEHDLLDRPSPFADFELTGADVFWLVMLAAGRGNSFERKHIVLPFFNAASNLNLEGARLRGAQLQGARLGGAQLQGVDLAEALLQSARLDGAQLQGASLREAQLQGAILPKAQLQEADLYGAQLQGAFLLSAQLQGADLREAQLRGASLYGVQLQGASLYGVELKAVDLTRANLSGADLREAVFDGDTKLALAKLDPATQVADVAWNGVFLIRVAWGQVSRLGDEDLARQPKSEENNRKESQQWLAGYEAAARAYRQLAIALRGQGITEAADRFTYRALIMQRKALWWQVRARVQPPQSEGASLTQHGPAKQVWHWLKRIVTLVPLMGSYLFSLFLAILTGYGFRMSRIILAYGLLILTFGGAYWGLDRHAQHPLTFGQALIVSITAFHGRVFSYNPFTLSDPQILVTAIEAICGLVIEGLFVAMLVQRFFNR